MNAPSATQTEIKSLQSLWLQLAGGAAWLGGIICSVLSSPPASHIGFDPMVRLPQIMITIVFGLLIVGALRSTHPKHVRIWVATCVLSGMAAVGFAFAYMEARNAATAEFDGDYYVTGIPRTDPDAVERHEACLAVALGVSKPEATQLLDCAHGRPAEFWTIPSIAVNQRRMVLLYIAAALFLEISIVSALLTLRLAASQSGAKTEAFSGTA